MRFVAHQAQPKNTVPLIYRLQRLFFAACIVLGMIAALVLVATSPQYYSLQNGPASMLASYATANPTLLQINIICSVIGVSLLPVGFLAMAWLAMRRAPWLASIAMLVVFIGVFPFPAFIAQNALTYDLVRMGNNPLFVTMVQRFNDDGVMNYYNTAFLLGSILAPALIGIALWRARAVPTWAAILITISRPLVFVYPFVQGFVPGVYVQLLSWVPLFIGSLPAAQAMLQRPFNESQKGVDQEA